MRKYRIPGSFSVVKSLTVLLLLAAAQPATLLAQPSLTIYNQNFAVVRDRIPLDLKAGDNEVSYTGVTAQMEPDSVVLRDPTGKASFQVLDQGYRVDTLSQDYLLYLNEGKTIDFIVRDSDNKEYTVKGKIIRSGYTPSTGYYRYNDYYRRQGDNTPIVEVDGKLRFSLPGEPVFPSLGDNALLQPTVTWHIAADAPVKFDAELSYVTNGLSWRAAYNLVAPEKGDTLDFVGWVTFDNNSGKEFKDATIKLMAGNVNKLQDNRMQSAPMYAAPASMAMMAPTVTEKPIDEFHLYTITRPVTLHDGEAKQIEFIEATGVKATTYYVYDGVATDSFRSGYNANSWEVLNSPEYGTQSNKKVWVMREFMNTKANGLGLALPAGRVRFYRRDDSDNSVQFVGENDMDHTPADERVRLYTGDAFDLVGERKQTDYQKDEHNQTIEEAFEINVRNHKSEAVEIRVVEHLYRWANWEILQKSDDFTKTDAQTIEFRVSLKPGEEKTITYRVRYNVNASSAPSPASSGASSLQFGALPPGANFYRTLATVGTVRRFDAATSTLLP